MNDLPIESEAASPRIFDPHTLERSMREALGPGEMVEHVFGDVVDFLTDSHLDKGFLGTWVGDWAGDGLVLTNFTIFWEDLPSAGAAVPRNEAKEDRLEELEDAGSGVSGDMPRHLDDWPEAAGAPRPRRGERDGSSGRAQHGARLCVAWRIREQVHTFVVSPVYGFHGIKLRGRVNCSFIGHSMRDCEFAFQSPRRSSLVAAIEVLSAEPLRPSVRFDMFLYPLEREGLRRSSLAGLGAFCR